MTNVGIHIRNVSVSYGTNPILDSLTLDVEPGEVIALLGASGCGKSTLLRAIANLVPVQSGDIGFTEHRRRSGDLAFVFQDATL
jgi:ABC-type sugar transport system ATPase subunit